MTTTVLLRNLVAILIQRNISLLSNFIVILTLVISIQVLNLLYFLLKQLFQKYYFLKNS